MALCVGARRRMAACCQRCCFGRKAAARRSRAAATPRVVSRAGREEPPPLDQLPPKTAPQVAERRTARPDVPQRGGEVVDRAAATAAEAVPPAVGGLVDVQA